MALVPALLIGCSDEQVVLQPEPDAPPTITLTAPAGGVAYAPGSRVDIGWTVSDDKPGWTVDLSYVADGGKSGTIAQGQTGTTYSWTVPSEKLFGVRVRATVKDVAGQTAMAETSAIFAVVASSRGYVNSTTCRTCHATAYDRVQKSGHPYKVVKVVDGKAPTFPFSQIPSPPEGYAWNDITYVVGGYGWKARFFDKDGYLLTTGLTGKPVQWNIARPDLGFAGGWGNYESAATAPKPYTCGGCHTTGWQTVAQNGGKNQDGLKGIAGTWEEPGVGCEACHGPGATHVATKAKGDVKVDATVEGCKPCHNRDSAMNIRLGSSGIFLNHRGQVEQQASAGHKGLTCVTCHEQHIGVRHGLDKQGGIKRTCESCHTDQTTNRHAFPLDCTTCHMPGAARSAINVTAFQGDQPSHIFKISSDPIGRSEMFFTQGNLKLSKGFVTLDFACYSCHKDPLTGQGGPYSFQTLEQLAARAKNIHK